MLKSFAALMLVAGFFVAGCNTMHGMGKDIERGGEKIQGSADTTQEKMKDSK
jgi:entericidin B